MMKRVGFALLLLLALTVGTVVAQSAETSTFEVAVRLYDNGSYEESAVLFQQLVDEGYDDGRLYHNLASAQHKLGRYGEAIVNYRRALELSPRSRDTRANLELARERVVDQFNRSDVSLFETITQVSNWMTLTEVGVIALLLWFALGFVWLRYRHAKTERQRTSMQSALIGLAALFVLLALAGGNRFYQMASRPSAVVVVDEVGVLEVQGEAEPLFLLHDGAEVVVVDHVGEWVKLTLPGDVLQGWVSAESVVYVSPEQR